MTKDRINYLRSLSEEYGVDFQTVLYLAEILGDTEDYDGLVTTIQDYAGGWL
jgi:hypothetical protein